jgi:hypothetical protein
MKPFARLFFAFMLSPLIITTYAQDRAVLRRDSATEYRAEVIIDTPAIKGAQVTAALYGVDDSGKRKQIQKFSGALPSPQPDDKAVFSIVIPKVPTDDDSFVVSVFELPTNDGVLSYDLPVTKLLDVSMRTGRQKCARGLQLTLRSPDYTLKNWQDIEVWANSNRRKPSGIGTVEVVNANIKSFFPISSTEVLTPPERAAEVGAMLLCLKVEPQLPDSSFKAIVSLPNAPTYDLQQPLVGNGLDPAPAPPIPTLADDNGVPGQRGFERNLDLGVTFSTTVEQKERENPETKAKEKFVDRTSRGVLDLRLAPWLYLGRKKEFDRDQKLYRYFNPIFLDAAVSTGKIDADTLSMNRVIFGSEYEWRYYAFEKDPRTGNTKTSPYVDVHRLILSGNHASDRDFKQLEYFGTFEYQPVLGALNHPLYLNWRIDETGRRVIGRFGYEIIPRFGFSLGRTYARRNPAAAIETSPTVRRFHTGLDMKFHLTRYVALSISDTFWVRGEADDDRFHNHFKGGIEAPLGRPFNNSVHSLFASFERGNEPPFTGRDANAFKIGYRIRAEGWGGRFR